MKKFASIIITLLMVFSCISFAGTENFDKKEKDTAIDFEWTASEEQLKEINSMNVKDMNEMEILRAVDLEVYEKLKKTNPEFVKSFENSTSKRGLLPPIYGNATWDSDYVIEDAPYGNQIFIYGSTDTAGVKTQDLGLSLGLYEGKRCEALYIKVDADVSEISKSFHHRPPSGTYHVHCRHAFGFINDVGEKEVVAPCSYTDPFEFSRD